MKRLLVILWIFCSFDLASQQIIDAEYYIDTDPGFGLGTPITITANQDISDLLVSIDVNGISEGIHNLIVRAKDDNGSWSLAHKQTFLKNQLPSSSPIDALEYYFDADPGEGNGTAISISSNVEIADHISFISTSGLLEGIHQLHVRSRREEGIWSHVQSKAIFVSPPIVIKNIEALEYYVNTDPGFGNGTSIGIIPANDLSNISAGIQIEDLNFGTNTISIRGMDAGGNWSHSSTRSILKMKVPNILDLVEMEYYFDTDPGFGKGTFVSYGTGPDLSDISVLISVNGLADGIHVLNIRSKDSNGAWSFSNSTIIQKSTLQELSDITAMEYYFDADPGFGSGTSISIIQGTEISDNVTIISTAGLTKGVHTLFVRSKNDLGEWSLNTKKSILIVNPKVVTDIVDMEYYINTDPGYGLGTSISISELPNVSELVSNISLVGLPIGIHHLCIRSKNSTGEWSHSYTKTFFYRKPDVDENIVEMEYFIGEDPGFGNGIDITVPSIAAMPDVVDLQHLIDLTTLDEGVQRINIRSKNDLGVWSHTYMKPVCVNKNVKGDMVKAEYFIDTDPGYGMATEVTFSPSLDKNNHVFPIDVSGLDFGIYRLHVRYMSTQNKWTLDEIRPIYYKVDALHEMVDGEYFIDTDPGFGLATSFTFMEGVDVPDISILILTAGFDVGVHDLYIRTRNANGEWSLTNVKIDIEIESALPLRILFFEVSKIGREGLLEWKVDEAINTSHFEIERTKDSDFTNIGRVESINDLGELEYEFIDFKPLEGLNYYRLKQVDLDGEFKYSAIRSLNFGSERRIVVYPNPSIDEIRVDGILGLNAFFLIYDSSNKLIRKGALESNASIDVSELLPGAYHFILRNGDATNSFLIVKI